ncbi:MAG: hypothetical protein KDD64_09595 [Bdellovibrionales bacterium]|nr:hypothetical protein [Bdellovibrionales bacterium]
MGDEDIKETTAKGALVDEADVEEADGFEAELQRTLRETEQAVLDVGVLAEDPDLTRSWVRAREIVEGFKPVPFFIWRLSHFVLGKPAHIGEVSQGLVFGLRRLLFAAASDQALGAGDKVNNVRKALNILKSDVIAAVAVIHAICRRLSNKPHERIWKPILEDAILRARLGLELGRCSDSFGGGRGMLAGFSGRAGLVVLIATSEIEEARKALEMLATGAQIRDVGRAVFSCDPLQVSAMMLSAAGCGRDAAFGTVSYGTESVAEDIDNEEQLRWFAAFSIIEQLRVNALSDVPQQLWDALEIGTGDQERLAEVAKKTLRRGHGWGWLLG